MAGSYLLQKHGLLAITPRMLDTIQGGLKLVM